MYRLSRLRAVREAQSMSLSDLAEGAAVDVPTLAGMEAGRVQAQPRTVRRLAHALGVEPSALGVTRAPGSLPAVTPSARRRRLNRDDQKRPLNAGLR